MSPVLLVFFGEVYVYTALGLHKYILAESPPPKELTAQTRGINSFCFTGGQRQLHLWHPQPAPHPQALPFHPRCWVLKAKAAMESSDHLAHRGRCPRAPALHPQTQISYNLGSQKTRSQHCLPWPINPPQAVVVSPSMWMYKSIP